MGELLTFPVPDSQHLSSYKATEKSTHQDSILRKKEQAFNGLMNIWDTQKADPNKKAILEDYEQNWSLYVLAFMRHQNADESEKFQLERILEDSEELLDTSYSQALRKQVPEYLLYFISSLHRHDSDFLRYQELQDNQFEEFTPQQKQLLMLAFNPIGS